MTHLNDTQFIDFIEDTIAPERRRHVDGCDACRAAADALRHTLERTAAADVPEPSPLFWEHFGARVNQAVTNVDRPATPASFDWLKPSNWQLPEGRETTLRWVEASAIALIVVAFGVWALVGRLSTPDDSSVDRVASDGRRPAPADAPPQVADVTYDMEADEAWALVQTIADDVSWDETLAAGVNTRPGSADRAALQLSGEERSELMRLLKAEMKQPGA
jgi:hypothetical protein